MRAAGDDSIHSLADFTFITARLATGAAIDGPEDVDELVAVGITHVIDCRFEFEDTPLLASHPSMSYLYNGVPDDGEPKGADWFAKSIEFALPALGLPRTKVYAHCAAGVYRGPSTAYAILRALGLSADDAEALIRRGRPVAELIYKQDADIAVASLGYA